MVHNCLTWDCLEIFFHRWKTFHGPYEYVFKSMEKAVSNCEYRSEKK